MHFQFAPLSKAPGDLSRINGPKLLDGPHRDTSPCQRAIPRLCLGPPFLRLLASCHGMLHLVFGIAAEPGEGCRASHRLVGEDLALAPQKLTMPPRYSTLGRTPGMLHPLCMLIEHRLTVDFTQLQPQSLQSDTDAVGMCWRICTASCSAGMHHKAHKQSSHALQTNTCVRNIGTGRMLVMRALENRDRIRILTSFMRLMTASGMQKIESRILRTRFLIGLCAASHHRLAPPLLSFSCTSR